MSDVDDGQFVTCRFDDSISFDVEALLRCFHGACGSDESGSSHGSPYRSQRQTEGRDCERLIDERKVDSVRTQQFGESSLTANSSEIVRTQQSDHAKSTSPVEEMAFAGTEESDFGSTDEYSEATEPVIR